MAEEIKFIFKTLVKVPIIIICCYIVLNAFTFVFSYFRLLGLSYMVMQTAVENNFLPENEYQLLRAQADLMTVDNAFDNIHIYCDTGAALGYGDADYGYDNPDRCDIDDRVQYGQPIRITVTADYYVVFPLINTFGKGFEGEYETEYNKVTTDGNQHGLSRKDITRHTLSDLTRNAMKITYEIPGLKYYPDLS